MSVTLEPVFSALGYTSPQQQTSLIKMLQAAGAFGQLPGVTGVLSDKQAEAVLKSVTFDNAQQAASWLHDLSQETMKRPEGVARTDTPERPEFTANRAELLEALRGAGMLSDAAPKLKKYDHVLLLGSKEPLAEARLEKVAQLWNDNVRFDKIHLLGSDRQLDTKHEEIANVPGASGEKLHTETQMLKARYYEMRNNWPDELKKVETFAVNSFDRDGHNANTKETIETWLSANPSPAQGNVLVISNQPYVAYQDAAVKSVLPENFHVETVGAAIADKDVNISLAMDAFARQVDVNFSKLVEKASSQSTELKASLTMLDPAKIKADPATYQFRSNYDQSGVTEKGRYHAEKWDPILHGDPLLVHERLDGSMYVADGHHRLNLAQSLNQVGTGPGNVAAMVLREADGYTPEDVKIIAAYKNIAHGNTDPIEVAKVFKEAYSGRIHTEYLPHLQMDKGNLTMSYHLSKLSDTALDSVVKNNVPLELAADVATRVSDANSQVAVIDVISEELKTKQAAAPQPLGNFTSKITPKSQVGSFSERARPAGESMVSFVNKLKSEQQPENSLAI